MTDGISANNSASVLQDNSGSVDRISVKILPFWPNDPEIWFLQVENQFTLANITSDATKFNYIVANIETAYISEVRDIIVSPPATERYSLAGTTVPDNIVRSLWLGRLPSSTQAILATQAKASLDAVAELADTISEAIAPSAQISEASNACANTIDKLTAELAEIKFQLASLSNAQAQTHTYRNRSNSRCRPYPRDRSYSMEHNTDILCWYHYRFGDKAQKCSPPCKHQGNIADSRDLIDNNVKDYIYIQINIKIVSVQEISEALTEEVTQINVKTL
ncbi:uncharacterized protein LOC114332016 [Diabrotica virgifera virgifera]|uniref:Uncharacterized protein LOC114332016 n=1 Tax=Diabrotica virgifera virgifera TaxID=50390 RepID=A0A6P7FXB5_DIAVI|nr:uncharacterized protein LOC114332016 [Diabrotica virgifera virgifera]